MAQYFNLTLNTTAPTDGIISNLNNYYNDDATITISANGASYMKVWTNQNEVGTLTDTEIPVNWEVYATSKTVSFSTQGTQYIHALFMDEVGNISSIVNSVSTIYDNSIPIINSVIINNGNEYTQYPTVIVRVNFANSISGINTIKLQGDIATGATTNITLTDSDRIAGYKDISTVLSSSTEGQKTIIVQIQNRTGTLSDSKSDTIILDTSLPVIDINAPDYNIISKEHTPRSGTAIEKYNDMCTFTWSSNKNLLAFKICVNEIGQTAAEASAIGAAYGSQNMTGGAVAANTNITSVICGADFAATDVVNDIDGAYEVIVYGQDEGGNWSAIHPLS